MAVGSEYCHIGLGVNSMHCVKVLRKSGVKSSLYGVVNAEGIDAALEKNPDCTHAMIQAPWIPVPTLHKLMNKYPNVHFVIRVHSQIAFLQVEPQAVRIIRELQQFQEETLNVTLSANSYRFCDFAEKSFRGRCLYLPNLYDIATDDVARWRSPRFKDTLRISSFGSLRIMKNHMTGAAAAMLVAKSMGCHLDFFVSVNRHEQGGKVVLASLRNMFDGLKWAKLVEVPWEDWPSFRRTVCTMDLCYQLSMSETFNIATADAASEGIPSVVGDAIEWVPRTWQVPIDNAEEAARVGLWLINDQDAGRDGRKALVKFNDEGVGLWKKYLESNPT
jgi:hypothetical protein